MNKILETKDLTKFYPTPNGYLKVFEGVDFSVQAGDFVAIMGVSGAGKTTLLNLLGALDRPTRGKVYLEGEDIFTKDERGLAEIRNKKLDLFFNFIIFYPNSLLLKM